MNRTPSSSCNKIPQKLLTVMSRKQFESSRWVITHPVWTYKMHIISFDSIADISSSLHGQLHLQIEVLSVLHLHAILCHSLEHHDGRLESTEKHWTPVLQCQMFITVEWWRVSVPVWCQILHSETVVCSASTLPLLLYQSLWPSQAPAQHTPSLLVSDVAVRGQSMTDRLFQTQHRIRNRIVSSSYYYTTMSLVVQSTNLSDDLLTWLTFSLGGVSHQDVFIEFVLIGHGIGRHCNSVRIGQFWKLTFQERNSPLDVFMQILEKNVWKVKISS